MLSPPNHWLLRVLRRILSVANSFTRRSIQRWLYLWYTLSRRFHGRKPSSDGSSSPPVFSTGSSAVETIHYESPGNNDSISNTVTTICPSTQPPDMHEMSGLASSPTASGSSMLRAHLYTQDLGTMSLARSAPDNTSVSSRHSVISVAPPSVIRRALERRPAQLRPYSYGGRSASRSSHRLASASRSNHSLENFSTTSHHRSPSSRAPSPALSSARSSSETSSYHISIEPESPLSNHSDVSDNFPNVANVATPAGEVALPETGEASLSSAGKLYQTVPEWIERYERDVHIPKTDSTYKLQPLQLDFPHDQPLPSEWTPLTHPEGALYFYHKDRRIFTDAYFLTPAKPDAELVLEVTPDKENGGIKCGYYFVHHQTRSLFWLDEFDADPLLYEIQGLTSAAHLTTDNIDVLHIRKHWELFPNNYTVSQDIIDELSETLLYANGDCLTSPVSTAPYSAENLNKMLNLVKQVKPGKRDGHSACYIGRLMYTFAHQKFLHFHGQNGARLCRDQSLYETDPRKRSLLITLLSPILFSAPDVHLRALGDIWVDDIIGHVSWNEFMTKLSSDWKEFTLYGTVLLNANVAFLAIQSVDTGVPRRSAAQLSSYGSIVVSVGCIILGLLLERQNRTKERGSALAASTFLSRMTHPSLGLESLAIMYSLPYALLMWGMLSFLAAFCFVCFDNTSIPTRSIVGATSAAIFALIFWSIWVTWESGEHYLLTLLSRIPESYEFAAFLVSNKSQSQWCLPSIAGMFVRRSGDSTRTSETVV